MRRMRVALLAVATACLVGLALALPASAAGQERVQVGDLISSSGDVLIPADTIIVGDVTVARGNLMVLGRVDGNVSVSRGNVDIAGVVTGDVRVSRGDVRVTATGMVHGQVLIANGRLSAAEGAVVSLTTPIFSVDDEGVIGPGFSITGRGVVGPGFSISDDGVFLPGLAITERGVQLGGSPSQSFQPFGPFRHFGPAPAFPTRWRNPFGHFYAWAGVMAFALVAVALFPRPIGRMAATVAANPVSNGLVGLLSLLLLLVLTVPLVVLLALTLVGIPLIPVYFFAVVAAGFVGFVAVSLALGQSLGRLLPGMAGSRSEVFLQVVVGVAALALIALVPLLWLAVGFVISLIGLGAVVRTRFGMRDDQPPPPAAAT